MEAQKSVKPELKIPEILQDAFSAILLKGFFLVSRLQF